MSFRRINFFRGLFMTADDWRTEQNYHIEKNQLHNRTFHTPGVVTGDNDELRESLKVSATQAGALLIQPGYAVDGLGRDLRLLDPKELVIASNEGPKEDTQLFIYITFEEERSETRESRLDPAQRDDAIVVERAKVHWTKDEPDNHKRLELARIDWQPGRRITQKHIDTSHVKFAGARHRGGQAVRVKHGEIELNANPAGTGLTFGADDTKVLIQTFEKQEDALNAVYVANVFPNLDQTASDARIFWRIESQFTRPPATPQIAYYLLMKNFGSQAVKVQYAVFRLNINPAS
jgi:hypothetical protein